MHDGRPIVAAVVEGCQGKDDAVQHRCGDADGQAFWLGGRRVGKAHETGGAVAVQIEIEGFGGGVGG